MDHTEYDWDQTPETDHPVILKSHRFDSAKAAIEALSKENSQDAPISKVDSHKSFGEGLGDFIMGRGIGVAHRVTGAELNDLVAQIQEHFISIGNFNAELLDGFGEVYNALEALDQDYIQEIVSVMQGTEYVNTDVKSVSSRLQAIEKKQETIENDQKKTIETQRKQIWKLSGWLKAVCCIAGIALCLAVVELVILLVTVL